MMSPVCCLDWIYLDGDIRMGMKLRMTVDSLQLKNLRQVKFTDTRKVNLNLQFKVFLHLKIYGS